MKKLKLNCRILRKILIKVLIISFFSKPLYSSDIIFEIKGNNFTDEDVILSLLKEIPEDIDTQYSNEIINTLNDSLLFSDVAVTNFENKFIITVKEYPNINNIYFKNNERLDDEDLDQIVDDSSLINFNIKSINNFINQTKKVYQSFGYNNLEINYSKIFYEETNTVDIYFDISEGSITKINNIIVNGNNQISSDDIKQIINSKTKSIKNIFANNNYKPTTAERDKYIIINYYKNNGYLDIKIETQVEFLKTNRVNLYYNINEGDLYELSSIKLNDEKNILSDDISVLVKEKIENYNKNEVIFSAQKILQLKSDISSLVIQNSIEFFEIKSFDKIIGKKVEVIFQIVPVEPRYSRQINIVGNSRTFDYVIRRELDLTEGDAVYKSQIKNIRNKLLSLNLFESVDIREELIDENLIDLIIEVEEKQTGTFNAGVSVGTLDGFSIVTGLRERNFYGTGRSLDVLVNTSEDKNQFKLITTDRLSYENDADISYSLNYKQQDFSKASSYKLDTFSSGIGIEYKINRNLRHNIDLEYVLKDYKVTNSSTVSSSILNSSGASVSYIITNNLRLSTLNPGFIPKKGNFLNFNNSIETPTSSNNGFIRNLLTIKRYHTLNTNSIFSIQTKFGNIFSLNNKDILTDDKFSLGGRWLRGFDNYGVGPRNSRTSYVGGNNLAVAKIDYSYAFNPKSNFPIYLNFFNDYGLVWDNKTQPLQSDNSLRSSAGFGLKYYSPIGPIAFTWGFPLKEEEYDIKRMFLFSIGNID